jgi:succinate dehydrogenase/fumarate reductase cytochrome b subunit
MIASLFLSLGGLGLLGGGLFVASMFFAPAASLLKSTFDFLRSPLGQALGVIALGLFLHVAGWIAGDVHGSNATRAAWRADNLAKAEAAATREAALRSEMKRIAGAGVSVDLAYSRSVDQKVQDYVAKTPAVACRRATGDDIVRLLSIK